MAALLLQQPRPDVAAPSTPVDPSVLEAAREAQQVLPKRKLQELLDQIDSSQTMDTDVQERLVDIANDFIERVVTFSCQLARHRGSDVLEARDIQAHLERSWDLRVPGFGQEDFAVPRNIKPADSHRQRLAAIQKDVMQVTKRRKIEPTASKKGAP